MNQRIRDFVAAETEIVALGEPVHQEPACGWLCKELFAQLVELGFGSIALETDRIAALAVDDFVREGIGALDDVMSSGFSHDFGAREPNRALVAWMREFNRNRPPERRLAFYGFDGQTENTTAPSPRRYLEYGRDYLGLDIDIAELTGADERWDREQAILDPACSVGATAEAARLRVVGEDLLASLTARAEELIAATSRAAWVRARTYLRAGLGLLRYHKAAARPGEQADRIRLLLAVRDGLMALNLLDIREIEAERGGTVLYAHNAHLQKSPASLRMMGKDLTWIGAGAIVSALLGERYSFVAGSLGTSDILGLEYPEPDSYEGLCQNRVNDWGLVDVEVVGGGRVRTVPATAWAYGPLGAATLDGADAIAHIGDAAVVRAKLGGA
ncbi:MAG TPA: erythromycin esterase family protein [Pseudonocardiaceae bacterium]